MPSTFGLAIAESLVSVVIPCRNTGDFVTRAIDSALAQSYQNLEVIVVDDGSTDDFPSTIARYGSNIRVIRQENRGPSIARNVGIDHAKAR
jgi:glycosyltransferase involved in cell wall biosynthesis